MTSAQDLGRILLKPTPILLYSDITRNPEGFISDLLMHQRAIVLVRTSERQGHWVALTLNLPQRKAYFFSSFGTRPDEDKMRYVKPQVSKQLGQSMNLMSRILRDYFKTDHNLEIHYNQYRYQDPEDYTDESCGLWCVLFINMGLDEDKFNDFVKQLCRKRGVSYKEFIHTFFK